MARWLCCARLFFAVLFLIELSHAAEPGPVPVTLDNVVDPGPNDSAEPLAADFSIARSVRFLDSAALTWQKERKCFTCHTNYALLYARPLVAADSAAHESVRQFAEELVSQRWKDQGPRWDAEVVATAAALAFNDAHTTGELHPLTRQALDKMWDLQREDGGWNWIKCDWPPMESDDDYGVTLAAIAVGVAPGNYAETEQARKGMERLRQYLADHPPPTLHHRAMLLWGASYIPALMTSEQKQACIDELLALQKADGGWALATLGDWQRADGSPQDRETSDGYGTGFVIYVLRRAGLPADDARLQRGVAWLKSHPRESGRWFTRSLHKDSKHFITHAGTAFAMMALAACEDEERTE